MRVDLVTVGGGSRHYSSLMTRTQAASAEGPSRSAPDGGIATLQAAPTFQAVYAEYFRFVWRCTRRLGVPLEALDDVVQEVFITIHRRLHTLEQQESLRSWVYAVVRKTVGTYHRSRKRRTAFFAWDPVLDDTPSALQPSPLDHAVMSDDVALLSRLLTQLDPPKREVLMLAELEEMPVPEIAAGLGIPLNTAYSRLRVARQEFHEALARHEAQQKPRR
jgi:RNA polymerase sigma-70 factor (ECF subfamily)